MTAGLFGSGGGLVVVPMFSFILLQSGTSIVVAMHIAVGTSLAIMIITSLTSTYTHAKMSGVLWKVVLRMLFGLCVGAILGGIFANMLPGHILYLIFTIFVILSALQLAFEILPKLRHPVHTWKGLSTFSFFSSIVSTVLGVGGSTLTVPFLIIDGIAIDKVAGTTSATTIPIAIVGAIVFLFAGLHKASLPYGNIGFINMPALAIISLVSMLTASYSAKFSHRLSEKMQRYGFVSFLTVVAVSMVWHLVKFS